uniref:ZP domain-containing protein n=1 Tax=Heterorhabditis bacteriophora TaxID=37862 RepID=A0A1I7WPP1_HETBA
MRSLMEFTINHIMNIPSYKTVYYIHCQIKLGRSSEMGTGITCKKRAEKNMTRCYLASYGLHPDAAADRHHNGQQERRLSDQLSVITERFIDDFAEHNSCYLIQGSVKTTASDLNDNATLTIRTARLYKMVKNMKTSGINNLCNALILDNKVYHTNIVWLSIFISDKSFLLVLFLTNKNKDQSYFYYFHSFQILYI